MLDLTDETFERDVLHAGQPVVVDFWAPWCGPCRAVEAILERLERQYESVAFARLNVDEHPHAASRFGVLSLPTAILFADGAVQATVVGARARSHYERVWAPWLTS